MNDLQIFNNEEFGEIRTVTVNGEPMIIANDVARALGYSTPKDAISRHCKGATTYRYLTNGGEQEMKVIPEGDIYRLIIKASDQSKNEEIRNKAEKFERWIFDEVLPTIRKTGGYVASEDLFINTYLPFADDSTKALFKQTLTVINQQNKKIEEQKSEITIKDSIIAEIQPKATYLDKILGETKELLAAGQIAQDYGMSAIAFNKKLHELHIQYKVNGQWVLYVEHRGNGYVQATTFPITCHDGTTNTKPLTKWTQKGRLFLYEELKKNNIIPIMDREQ